MIGSEGVEPGDFHALYEGKAPWDLDGAQPEVAQLLDHDRFSGRILDVGCGTGQNAMLLAAAGHDVTAIDFVPRAVEQATSAADAQGLDVHWLVGDALHLTEHVTGQFDTVLDSGVFHVFGDADRGTYIKQLKAVTAPGGTLHVIVFSDKEGGTDGPRRIRRQELIDAFQDGWVMEKLRATKYGIRTRPGGAKAWRGTWRRQAEHGF